MHEGLFPDFARLVSRGLVAAIPFGMLPVPSYLPKISCAGHLFFHNLWLKILQFRPTHMIKGSRRFTNVTEPAGLRI